MTTYQDFVKAHVAQMPGKSPQARMREVAAKWRELPASQKTSIAKLRAASVIKGTAMDKSKCRPKQNAGEPRVIL